MLDINRLSEKEAFDKFVGKKKKKMRDMLTFACFAKASNYRDGSRQTKWMLTAEISPPAVYYSFFFFFLNVFFSICSFCLFFSFNAIKRTSKLKGSVRVNAKIDKKKGNYPPTQWHTSALFPFSTRAPAGPFFTLAGFRELWLVGQAFWGRGG